MKLKNKKTGQIGNFIINKDHFECVDLDYVPEYRNIAELNAEWEDVPEEPEIGYIIDTMEEDCICDAKFGVDLEDIERAKELGIWFEAKEEAEKAVEKLKAWKRLKDKGFKFDGGDDRCISYTTDIAELGMQGLQDFKILFGGEE